MLFHLFQQCDKKIRNLEHTGVFGNEETAEDKGRDGNKSESRPKTSTSIKRITDGTDVLNGKLKRRK